MRSLLLTFCLLFTVTASANYAMDPQRKPDPAFAKFFLNRIDSWFRTTLYDYRAKLPAADRKFVEEYLADPRTLGEVKAGGFIRSYSYSFKAENGKITYGPFRFVRPTPTSADIESFARVLKAHGIAVPKNVIGLGFLANANELEVITLGPGTSMESSGLASSAKETLKSLDSVMFITLYKSGQRVSVAAVERGVTTATRCAVSPANEQIDRVFDGAGEHFAFHSSDIEEEAFSMEGRQLVHKIQVGLELSPGVVDYHSQVHYGLAYP